MSVKASKIGLLFLILGFGGTVETAWRVRDHLGVGAWDWRVLTGGKFTGPSYTFEETQSQAVPEGTTVAIENAFGDVKTIQGTPGTVRVVVRKVVYRLSESEAAAFAGRIHLVQAMDGATLRLGTNRIEVEKEKRQVGFETHLEVALPPGTRLKVQNEHGAIEVADVADADIWGSYEDIRVERVAGAVNVNSRHGSVVVVDTKGALSLSARHGSVEVRGVAGKAAMTVEHGDVSVNEVGGVELNLRHGTLTADGILGDLEMTGEHAGVHATAVTGRAVVETSFQDVEVERVGGDVRLISRNGVVKATDVTGAVYAESRYDDVRLARIGGPVEVHVMHGGLEAEGLEKGAVVRTAGDDVVIEGFKGPLDVQSDRGSVRLAPSGPLAEPLSVRAVHGGIELAVPAGSRFTLDATSVNGEVSANVSGFTITQSGAQRVTGMMNGGGPAVTLAAEGGNVELRSPAVVTATEHEGAAAKKSN
jgi:hypothetical protein